MADTEVLNYYNLTTLNLIEWPAEKDEDYVSEDELSLPHGQVRPKYASLERGPSLRESVPGSQRGKDGSQNMVQKDEPDPLGTGSSVMQLLHRQGLRANDDRLRNQFLLSSTTFSPSLYLAQAHSDASTEELLRGLEFLSNSIEKKSASLKSLVESNFERFVRAKATIDNVYSEMQRAGIEDMPEQLPSPASLRPPRTPSTQGFSLRKSGRPLAQSYIAQPPSTPRSFTDDRKKNALVKESDYGVQGIRAPLNEANGKADEIWGPTLGGKDKEENLRSVLATIDRNRGILDIGIALDDCITANDYNGVASNFERAHKYAVDAKNLAERAKTNNIRLSDSQLQQILVTARVWMDVQTRVNAYKRDVEEKLSTTSLSTSMGRTGEDEGIELVSLLLNLGVEQNPITMWLRHGIEHLRSRVSNTFDRARIELEVSRRKLANGRRTSSKSLTNYLRTAGKANRKDHPEELDTPQAIAFWEKVWSSLNNLLSVKTGLLGEVIEFADTVQSFIDGKRQRTLPMGIEGESRKHHRFTPGVAQELQESIVQVLSMVQAQVRTLLVDAPPDDVSTLLTSIPQSPATPASATLSPSRATRFNFKLEDMPPPSPRTGEAWEKYAFWPPNSNCLSAGVYLQRIVTLTATAATDIASNGMASQDGRLLAHLRDLVNEVRERSGTALCAAWLADSDNCRELEAWTRSADRKDLTELPARLSAFEMALLDNLRTILFLPDLEENAVSSRLLSPAPNSVVEIVRRAFKSSMLKALSAVMEHAAKADLAHEDDELTMPSTTGFGSGANDEGVDSSNTNVRKILTMSNLSHLRSDTIPKLCTHFESTFSVSLTDDLKSLRDTLHQMHSRVFQAYIRPTVDHLRTLITSGIITPSYAPPNPNATPTDARPYVYEVLLTLVLVHAEVSSTAPPLTSQILSTLFEQISAAYLHAFKQRQRYSLAALMQATLDVEFTAQTLNLYTTDKVADVQGQIYMALDERTDNEARLRLQTELPQMRAILKRLREGTRGSFGCFKKEKRREKEKEGKEGRREG